MLASRNRLLKIAACAVGVSLLAHQDYLYPIRRDVLLHPGEVRRPRDGGRACDLRPKTGRRVGQARHSATVLLCYARPRARHDAVVRQRTGPGRNSAREEHSY